jgi:uncharacterized membrane protein
MTDLKIQKMKDTECLALTKWQFFWYYSSIYILLSVSIIITITTIYFSKHSIINKYNIVNSAQAFEVFLYKAFWLILVLALIFYYLQTKRLKFKVINIHVGEDKFKEAAQKTAKELNWKLIEKTGDIIIAKSGFSWKSWGELITIIRDNERILINSICDPDKSPSIASYGMNRKNRETYERFVIDCI